MPEIKVNPKYEAIGLTYPEIKVFAMGFDLTDGNFFIVADEGKERYNCLASISLAENSFTTLKFDIKCEKEIPEEVIKRIETNVKEAIYTLSEIVQKNIILMPPPVNEDGTVNLPPEVGQELMENLQKK